MTVPRMQKQMTSTPLMALAMRYEPVDTTELKYVPTMRTISTRWTGFTS